MDSTKRRRYSYQPSHIISQSPLATSYYSVNHTSPVELNFLSPSFSLYSLDKERAIASTSTQIPKASQRNPHLPVLPKRSGKGYH